MKNQEPSREEKKQGCILSPEWFSNPPNVLDYWRFRCLTRLTLFVDSLHTRRLERHRTSRSGGA